MYAKVLTVNNNKTCDKCKKNNMSVTPQHVEAEEKSKRPSSHDSGRKNTFFFEINKYIFLIGIILLYRYIYI